MRQCLILSVPILIAAQIALCAVHRPAGAADQSPIPSLVAANDAPQAWKDAAGYVGDGTADDVQIQDALDNTGAAILSPGTFDISSSIVLDDGEVIEGQGWGLASYPSSSAGTSVLDASSSISVITAIDKDYFRISNIKIVDGNIGIDITTTNGSGVSKNFIVSDVMLTGQGGSGAMGVRIEGYDGNDLLSGWRLNNVFVRESAGKGIYIRNTSDWFGTQWYTLGTNDHGITLRDSASFNVNSIRGDFAGPGSGGNYVGIRMLAIYNATLTNIATMGNNGAGLKLDVSGSDVQLIGGWMRDNGQDAGLTDAQRSGIIVTDDVDYVTIQGIHALNIDGTTQQYGMLDVGPTHTVMGNTFHDNTAGGVRDIDPDAIMLGNRIVE